MAFILALEKRRRTSTGTTIVRVANFETPGDNVTGTRRAVHASHATRRRWRRSHGRGGGGSTQIRRTSDLARPVANANVFVKQQSTATSRKTGHCAVDALIKLGTVPVGFVASLAGGTARSLGVGGCHDRRVGGGIRG